MTLSLFFSAATLALCGFFFVYLRHYLKSRTSAGRLLGEYRNEVLRLIADIDAATDRDSLLVEERIKTLKRLLEDTDRRISVYIRELDRSRSGAALYANLGRGAKAGGPATEDQAAAPAEDVRPPAEKILPASPPALSSPAVPSPAPEGAEAVKDSAGKQPLRETIVALAAQDLSPADIASRLKISLSEVDLALNLLGRGGRP
ncbi:MAG: hypothetical protein LBS57_13035 [Treponema sp.]|jgi:hypothetical protein|nr:hypothetical protein [Treponema sp.]